MKCSVCGKEAIVEVRYEGKAYCEKHFVDRFKKRVWKTVVKTKMIKPKERVAFGLSGGKDSSVALYILKPILEKWRSEFFAITIDQGISGYGDKLVEFAKKLTSDLGVEHYVYSMKDEIGVSIDEVARLNRPRAVCSYCGAFRRWILNKKARELGADKLVIGHNLDDEAQTALMNFIRGDLKRTARMGADIGVIEDPLFVPRVKPLREIPEREIKLFAYLKGLSPGDEQCPYVEEAFRKEVRKQLNTLEAKFPGTKFSILRSNDRLVEILRDYYKEFGHPNKCKICGELTAGDICKKCQFLAELGLRP